MKLITEVLDTPLRLVEEIVEGKAPRQFLEGIFMQGGIKNRNNRIYPIEILTNECNRYITEHVSKNRAVGELGHPEGPSINLDRVCIHIKNLRQEEGNFYGKALIASTPMGSIVKNLISDGASLGVSTRAVGSLKPISEGVNEVQADLRLLAIDVVQDPSAPDAYVNSVMENKEWVYNPLNGTWTQQIVETHKKQIKNMSMSEFEKKKFAIFEQFLNSIER